MKALLINGSPHKDGTTARALTELLNELLREGVAAEIINVGSLPVSGCVACGYCKKNGKCVFDDAVNEAAAKFKEADALIVGSPVYYASPNGTLISFLDRLFHSSTFDKSMKIGASVVCARRGGCSASFDMLNKYFTISSMPIAASTYWNMVHGASAADAELDLEGLETMRNLARNIAFLIKSIALGKEKYGMPLREKSSVTNFIKR